MSEVHAFLECGEDVGEGSDEAKLPSSLPSPPVSPHQKKARTSLKKAVAPLSLASRQHLLEEFQAGQELPYHPSIGPLIPMRLTPLR